MSGDCDYIKKNVMKIEYDFSYEEILELIKYNKYTIRKLDRDVENLNSFLYPIMKEI